MNLITELKTNLNTSHVKVKHETFVAFKIQLDDLNTSHVKVKLDIEEDIKKVSEI